MRSKCEDVMPSMRCLDLASSVLFQVYVGISAILKGSMVEQSSLL
jgi:hypothetical protein